MSKYEIDELNRLWRLQRLTIEQALGQLTLHAKDSAQQLPDQSKAIYATRDRLHEAMWEMRQLSIGGVTQKNN